MIRLWEFLIHGCWHQWRAMEKVRLVKNERDEIGYGMRYTYQCGKCHRIKKQDVK
jgi:hypothetical protein